MPTCAWRRGVLRLCALLWLCALSACGVSTGLSGSAPEGLGRTPILYRVRPGDTIWGIGQRYGQDGRRLIAWNDLDDPERLDVGQQLIVGFRGASARTATSRGAASRNGLNRGAGADTNATMGSRDRRQNTASRSDVQTVATRNSQSGGKGDLAWPLHTGRVLSGFGPRSGSFHDGIDIAAPDGTPVYAAHGGTVIHAGDDIGGYGNIVIIRHRTGLISVYAHNSRLLVSEGDAIERGAQIALVGATGHATGPHLHFEVRVQDRQGQYVAVDPLPLLTDARSARPRYRINEGLRAIFSRFVPSSGAESADS